MDQLSDFDVSKFPLENAVKVVRGDGSRHIVTFEDPNCGYCKRLMTGLAKIDNSTTYTFLVNILGGDSDSKAKCIWCAPDRATVWVNYMSKGGALPENEKCQTPISDNVALYQQLRISGTPHIRTRYGKIPGYTTAAEIEKKLQNLEAQQAK